MTEGNQDMEFQSNNYASSNKRHILLIIFIFLLVIILTGISYFIFNKFKKKENVVLVTPPVTVISSSTPTTTEQIKFLPNNTGTESVVVASSTDIVAVENLNFKDFYPAMEMTPFFEIKDYELPLNVKIDVLNYYSVARKINLDNSLESLNNNGFAIIDNFENNSFKDFYSVYNHLAEKEIPLLITSDFILNYHQDIKKQVFKEIEENIFYDNLWKIVKELYDSSKSRYESHLARIGNVNNSVLEGERLSTAYFAVALKLLEPSADQIDNSLDNKGGKFNKDEAKKLYFNILPYLLDDAGKEVELIRSASGFKKSPVLLYDRDYKDFVVPEEYKNNDKLYNFYLASTWLNSVFPVVVKNSDCPECLLDKDDARLSLIAASFITHDFSANQEIKNRWALIYKILSYFKGLRSDLNYLNYNDSLVKVFGDDYKIEEIFADDNNETNSNLEKLRTELLSLNFLNSGGALDKEVDKKDLGFKFLSDYYWPNNYIFSELSGEQVGEYQKEEDEKNVSNFTICRDSLYRCNGFSLDLIALINDNMSGEEWESNATKFLNYNDQLARLKKELDNFDVWHTNNFWFLMDSLKSFNSNNDNQMQVFSKNSFWQDRMIRSSVSAWIKMQTPFSQPVVSIIDKNASLTSVASAPNDLYIEPNYLLVKKMLLENQMLTDMFKALEFNDKLAYVESLLSVEKDNLSQMLEIIKKELNSEELSSDDNYFIFNLATQYQKNNNNVTEIKLNFNDRNITEKLKIKLLILIYGFGDVKSMAIGPIYDYEESH